MAEISRHIADARQATEADSLYRRRVDLIDAGILQHMVKSRAKYEESAMSEKTPIATAGVAPEALAESRSRLKPVHQPGRASAGVPTSVGLRASDLRCATEVLHEPPEF